MKIILRGLCFAGFLYFLDAVGVVLGGAEGFDEGAGDFEAVAAGDFVDGGVGIGEEALHGGIGEGAEGEHQLGASGGGAEGGRAKADTDEGGLAERFDARAGSLRGIEGVELLHYFGHGEAGVDAEFGGGGVGFAAVEAEDDAGGGGGKGVRAEHDGAERIARDVVQGVDCPDVVLLQDAAFEHGAGALAGLLGGLEEQQN